MSRWAEWLPTSSSAASARSAGLAPPVEDGPQRGVRLGLPAVGPGAVAGFGRRLAAVVIDIVLAALVAGLFTAPELPRNWSLLAWAVLTVFPVAVFGMTTGMTMLGLRVLRVDGRQFVGVPRALLRTALLFLIIPAAMWDEDNRGVHDRAAGTVVVRTR